MISYFLIVTSFVLTGVLGGYGAGLFWLIFSGLFKPEKRISELTKAKGKDSIDILIPSHHELVGALNAIGSVQAQNYRGTKHIYLLLKDRHDNSIPLLEKAFDVSLTDTTTLTLEDNATLQIVFCGVASKKEKLRYILPKITSPYIAILDADHKAQKDWLKKSVAFLLEHPQHVCVQGSREPLSTNNIFQLWDSAQNHIGNEMFSRVLSKKGFTVFFTGTTALFEAEALKALSFSDCVTEDTYLSYQILLSGNRIGHIADSGSREELAPNVASYVARRRRWSNGHNQTFLEHWKSILFAPELRSQRGVLWLHGMFFLIPLLVFLLLLTFAVFSFFQYDGFTQSVILLISGVLSILLHYVTRKTSDINVLDILVAFLWIAPQVAVFTTYWLYYTENDQYFYLLNFPFLDDLLGSIQLILLGLPLIILFFGLYAIRLFPLRKILLLVLTYPLFLFLDIYAILLGLGDLIVGHQKWFIVSRTHLDDTEKNRRLTSRELVRNTLWAGLVGILLLGGYLFFTHYNCGESTSFLKLPHSFLFNTSSQWEDAFEVVPVYSEKKIKVTLSGRIESQHEIEHLNLSLDQERVLVPLKPFEKSGEALHEKAYTHELFFPMGFEAKKITLSTSDGYCKRHYEFPTTAKEIRGRQVLLNGEPFLVKGVVPSFKPSKVSFAQGFSQIKALGGNLIRTYHRPTNKVLREAQKQNILVLPQTNQSNWGNTNLNNFLASHLLSKKYENLQKDFYKSPMVFMTNFGNEMELGNYKLVPKIFKMLEKTKTQKLRNFVSYSTYLVFVNYPVEILSVNMLDTGDTYWDKALEVIRYYNKPFLATELGGFTAFYESTDPVLRAYRLWHQWEALLENEALGGIIFESHDNWAQPVPTGFNDPFSPEQPDDLRGIWTQDNKPKPIKQIVEAMFADLSVEVVESDFLESQKLTLLLKNKRDYVLEDIALHHQGDPIYEVFSLEPKAEKSIQISTKFLENKHEVTAHYTTHKGLTYVQNLNLPVIDTNPEPFVQTPFWIEEDSQSGEVRGLILSDNLKGFLP
ncbi:MAG TPA: glycosyltransferase family 2 protein, partial [Candidatus Gracilibacteria bacterium]